MPLVASFPIPMLLKQRAQRALDRLLRGGFAASWDEASRIPGWTGRREAIALHESVLALPGEAPVVVEVGSFLGRSTVVLAGACRMREAGRVVCVDPFDGSGDAYSEPEYERILGEVAGSPVEEFWQNLRWAEVDAWVEVRRGTAQSAAVGWEDPVDLLFLDGDHSPAGMREAFAAWAPFLRRGGVLAVHNSAAGRMYAEGHDGGRRLVEDHVKEPAFTGVRCVDSTTFAIRR